MTDPTTPAAPEPTPYAAPVGAAAAKSPILSIISLISGILGFLGAGIAFLPIVGIIAWFLPIAAIVLGFLGKKKEPATAKGLWLTGIILGFLGLAICLIGVLFWIVALIASSSSGYQYQY